METSERYEQLNPSNSRQPLSHTLNTHTANGTNASVRSSSGNSLRHFRFSSSGSKSSSKHAVAKPLVAPASKEITNDEEDSIASRKLLEHLNQAKNCNSHRFAFSQALLQQIPLQIGTLNNLKELNFSFNNLSCLPNEISNLVQLQILNLSENQFTEIPSVILGMTSLSQLNMSGNQIRRLPSEIENLMQLEQLHLGDNLLSTLPQSIGKLEKLQILHLHKNQFTALPTTIGTLKSLISLYLQDNMLMSIPSELCQISSLRNLFVQNNRLTYLPPSVGSLKQMWWLNVSENYLNTFPSSLGRLSKTLTDFICHSNPLDQIPKFLHSDPRALLVYLEQELPPDVIVSSLVLPHDLKTMVNSKMFSDLVADVNGTEIYLHKCLLYARRSRINLKKLLPTLSSFENDTHISITHIPLPLFLEILDFIYTGNSQKILANPSKYAEYIASSELEEENSSFEKLSTDLKQLWKEEKFSDVQFSVGGQLISAHKTIICCRCAPMGAMFTNPHFLESNMKVLPVLDVTFEIFCEMMEFIYTGNCNITEYNATELLVVANLYHLQRLKEMCEKAIEAGVDDQNRIQLLQFSNIYQAMQLEEICAHAIVKMKDKDYNRFISSEEYNQLSDDVKSLIKRKRDALCNFFASEEEESKKNRFRDVTVEDDCGRTFVNKIAFTDMVFNYQGTMDFNFSVNSELKKSGGPNAVAPLTLMDRLEILSSNHARSIHSRRRGRRKNRSKGESEIITNQFSTFTLTPEVNAFQFEVDK